MHGLYYKKNRKLNVPGPKMSLIAIDFSFDLPASWGKDIIKQSLFTSEETTFFLANKSNW